MFPCLLSTIHHAPSRLLTMHTMQPRFALLLLGILLSSCGFHLRGSGATSAEIQADRIYVGQSGAQNVASEVRSLLQLTGVKVTKTPEEAEYAIRLAGENIRRDVLSVSPQTGKVEEYQLTLSVLLSLTETGGEKLLSGDQVSLVRDFTFDQDAVLGKFSEEELLREELTREAAEQVLRRVSATIAGRQQ